MKNAFTDLGDGTCLIHIVRRNGTVVDTRIDTADLAKAASFPGSWCVGFNDHIWVPNSSVIGGFYIQGHHGRARVRLSRFLTDAPEGLVVDYINHDTLDNRRSNLRVVDRSTDSLNLFRAKADNRSSGMRCVNAVSYNPHRFQARVKVEGVSHYLGVFGSKEEAAEAVAKKLAELGVPTHAA